MPAESIDRLAEFYGRSALSSQQALQEQQQLIPAIYQRAFSDAIRAVTESASARARLRGSGAKIGDKVGVGIKIEPRKKEKDEKDKSFEERAEDSIRTFQETGEQDATFKALLGALRRRDPSATAEDVPTRIAELALFPGVSERKDRDTDDDIPMEDVELINSMKRINDDVTTSLVALADIPDKKTRDEMEARIRANATAQYQRLADAATSENARRTINTAIAGLGTAPSAAPPPNVETPSGPPLTATQRGAATSEAVGGFFRAVPGAVGGAARNTVNFFGGAMGQGELIPAEHKPLNLTELIRSLDPSLIPPLGTRGEASATVSPISAPAMLPYRPLPSRPETARRRSFEEQLRATIAAGFE